MFKLLCEEVDMKRIALFIVMKMIGWFDLEVEVLELLSPKPIPVPVPEDVPFLSTMTNAAPRPVTPEKDVKKILKKEIKKKELPKKPLLKKKVKTK